MNSLWAQFQKICSQKGVFYAITNSMRQKTISVFLVLLLGIGLRFVWIEDMEYKDDERKLFYTAKQGQWTKLGMISSSGLRNPALSDWVFIALAKIGQVEIAPELSFMVRLLNSLALVLLVWLAYRYLSEFALWGSMLAAVNPFMILFQRKIWAQSVLPIFCVCALWGLLQSRKNWGAFLFAFMALISSQIHMAGFFWLAAMLIWLGLFHRHETKWLGIFLGLLAATPPLVPWIEQMIEHSGRASWDIQPLYGWGEVLRLRFWRYWFTEPLGLKLTYSLGAEHFREFLRFPFLGINYCLHGIAATIGLIVYSFAVKKLWQKRKNWQQLLSGRQALMTSAIAAAFFGYGLFLSLYTINNLVYRHYMISIYPLTVFFFSGLAFWSFPQVWARRVLATQIVVQVLISFFFVLFIHQNGGIQKADADYGTVFRLQENRPFYIDKNGDLQFGAPEAKQR